MYSYDRPVPNPLALCLLTAVVAVLLLARYWPDYFVYVRSYNLHRAFLFGASLITISALLFSRELQRRTYLLSSGLLNKKYIVTVGICLILVVALSNNQLYAAREILASSAVLLTGLVFCLVIPRNHLISIVTTGLTLSSLFAVLEMIAYSQSGMKPLLGDTALGFDSVRALNHIHTLAIPLVLSRSISARPLSLKYWTYIACTAIALSHVLFTGGRGTLVGLVCGLTVAAMVFDHFPWKKWILPYGVSLLLAIVIFSVISSGWSQNISSDAHMIRYGTSGRLELWIFTLNELFASKGLGIGPGEFAYSGGSVELTTPHNSLLLSLAEYGVLATALISVALWKVTVRSLSAIRRSTIQITTNHAAAISLFSAFAHSMVSGIHITPTGQLFSAITIAIFVKPAYQEIKQSPSPEINPLGLTFSYIIYAILAFFLANELTWFVLNATAAHCEIGSVGNPRLWAFRGEPCSNW